MEKLTKDHALAYWMDESPHSDYVDGDDRSDIILRMMGNEHSSISILEIGCNIGRNLAYLQARGYHNLYGVEPSPRAVNQMAFHFPKLKFTFYVSSIESCIDQFRDEQFDVVFTMAVLMHIHPDSEYVFEQIARITKNILITVEHESTHSERCWPRGYKEIFEEFQLKQDKQFKCDGYSKMQNGYIARRFIRG